MDPALSAQTWALTCGLERSCLEGGVLNVFWLQLGAARGPRCHRPQGHVVGAFLV